MKLIQKSKMERFTGGDSVGVTSFDIIVISKETFSVLLHFHNLEEHPIWLQQHNNVLKKWIQSRLIYLHHSHRLYRHTDNKKVKWILTECLDCGNIMSIPCQSPSFPNTVKRVSCVYIFPCLGPLSKASPAFNNRSCPALAGWLATRG